MTHSISRQEGIQQSQYAYAATAAGCDGYLLKVNETCSETGVL